MGSQKKQVKISNEVRESLKKLGFTDYFVNIYVGLLEHGEMNAHDLSKVSRVPYSRIYEVLNDMVKKEIITKIDGRPSTFVANDPQDVFKIVKQRLNEEFEKSLSISLPFLKQLYGDKGQAKNVQFTLHEGKKAYEDHIRNVINASAHVLQIALRNFETHYPIIRNNLDFMRTKGVSVKLLTEERFKDDTFLNTINSFIEVRMFSFLPENFLISDEKIALQSIRGNFNLVNPHLEDFVVFTSTNSVYISYMKKLFDLYWERSTPLKEKEE